MKSWELWEQPNVSERELGPACPACGTVGQVEQAENECGMWLHGEGPDEVVCEAIVSWEETSRCLFEGVQRLRGQIDGPVRHVPLGPEDFDRDTGLGGLGWALNQVLPVTEA